MSLSVPLYLILLGFGSVCFGFDFYSQCVTVLLHPLVTIMLNIYSSLVILKLRGTFRFVWFFFLQHHVSPFPHPFLHQPHGLAEAEETRRLWLQGPHSCPCLLCVSHLLPVTCLMHIHTVYPAHTCLAARVSANTIVL